MCNSLVPCAFESSSLNPLFICLDPFIEIKLDDSVIVDFVSSDKLETESLNFPPFLSLIVLLSTINSLKLLLKMSVILPFKLIESINFLFLILTFDFMILNNFNMSSFTEELLSFNEESIKLFNLILNECFGKLKLNILSS